MTPKPFFGGHRGEFAQGLVEVRSRVWNTCYLFDHITLFSWWLTGLERAVSSRLDHLMAFRMIRPSRWCNPLFPHHVLTPRSAPAKAPPKRTVS
jgi:hypothetical protein